MIRLPLSPVLGFPLFMLLLLAGGCATTPPSSAGREFIGTWALRDTDGSLFDLIVRPDGTAITNWSKGESGARGKFGRWKAAPGRVVVNYADGWTDIIARKGSGHWKTSYGPGARRDGPPTNQGPAKRVKGKQLPFVGVWETTAVENDAPFFMALRSDGTAAKTIVPDSKGNWKLVDGAAIITWDDGWVDRIRAGGDGYTNEAWQPGKNTYPGKPTGIRKTWMAGTD